MDAEATQAVLHWLLDADPSLRWQVLRDLTDAPPTQIAMERDLVATDGVGARVLAQQRADGTWGGVAWNHGWDSTMHALLLLRDLGLDPASAQAIEAVARVRDQVTWQDCGPEEVAQNAFFDGEIEPCINGQVAAAGAYFRQDVRGLIDRLLSEQLADGGWNCEAERGSTRSSFNTTICVLDALLEYEQSIVADAHIRQARLRGEEYLLERQLLRRKSTGALIAFDRKSHALWTQFAFPTWWHYDVLRGLDYLRRAQVTPDTRISEGMALVASKRDASGRWACDVRYPGRMPVDVDGGAGEGAPSRWITLRALCVMHWHADGAATASPGA